MYYHALIMTIYAYLKDASPGADPATLKSAATARRTCINAAHALSGLVAIHGIRWSFSRTSATNIHFFSLAEHMLVDDLQNDPSRAAFITLYWAAVPMAERCHLPKGLLRMVEISALQAKPAPPMEVVSLFEDFERRFWEPEYRKRFSSRFPHFAIAFQERGAEADDGGGGLELEMDRVLEAWGDLTVADVKAAADQAESSLRSGKMQSSIHQGMFAEYTLNN
jgi:hypothetical protein